MSGLFLRRLRQPVLVGYIFAGILLGPSVLGVAQTTTTIEWLAELGIVLLMFMIGLELDMRTFRASLGRALRSVILQIALAIGAMALLSLVVPVSYGFAILIGSSIALSSTAVAITILKDMRQEHTDAGSITTSILIAQDLAVVPLLILIQLVSGDALTMKQVLTACVSLGVVVVTLGGIMYLTHHPRLVRKLQSLFEHGAEQPALAALAGIFIAAAVSGYAGLSSAYGAFALGLMLRNVGSIGDTYKQAIEPLHDLLLMVFFLSVGFMINIQLLSTHALLIGSLLLIVVFLKTAGNILIVRGTHLSWRGTLLAAAALSQIGEFSFVLLGIGLENTLISQEQYQLGLMVIALSLVISPLWVAAVKRVAGIRNVSTFVDTAPDWDRMRATVSDVIRTR